MSMLCSECGRYSLVAYIDGLCFDCVVEREFTSAEIEPIDGQPWASRRPPAHAVPAHLNGGGHGQ